MRSQRTGPGNKGLRLLACFPLLLFLGPFVATDGLGKGGTNMHERFPVSRAGAPAFEPAAPTEVLGGCGRGRYRDSRTHKCRGPADFGN